MNTVNDNMAWNDRDDDLRQNSYRTDELDRGELEENTFATDMDFAVDPDEDEDLEDDDLEVEELDDDDELAVDPDEEVEEDFVEDDDEFGVDTEEIEEDNLDDDDEYVNNLSDDQAFARNYDETEGDEFNEDKDFEAHLSPESVDPDPNEIPEQQESDNEGSGYHSSPERDEPQEGNDASFSEQTDVTPPNQHEFPSEGPGKGNFETRDHGRTTGRMLGHEPGTEGI